MTTVTTPLAAALAQTPGVVRVLLVKHVADQRGRCRVCRTGDQQPMWPCGLAVVAAAAQRLIDADVVR